MAERLRTVAAVVWAIETTTDSALYVNAYSIGHNDACRDTIDPSGTKAERTTSTVSVQGLFETSSDTRNLGETP